MKDREVRRNAGDKHALPSPLVAASLIAYAAAALLSLYLLATHAEGTWAVPRVLEYGLTFRISPLSSLFILIASIAWLLAGLFSTVYIEHSHAAAFHPAFFLSFIFTTGIFASGDFLTLFLFFELLTLSSYLLVRFEGTGSAERTGMLYLYMSLAGGLMVLAGIFLISWYARGFSFSGLSALPEGAKLPATILLMAGFGVKAGLPALNVWLPEAHPVAPAPASAVLSGVMIKVGVYGIILTLWNAGEAAWLNEAFLALGCLGLFNIWWGGLRALREENLKRILAFSSISQVGYILVGIGAAGAFGHHGHGFALAASGALYHIAGHSLFKACLFLVAGGALLMRGSVSLKDISEIGRSSPWISLGAISAVLAVTGFPGLTGFVSKTLIHEALLEAVHDSESGMNIALVLEKGFLWGSYLTALYFGRVFVHLFGQGHPAVQGGRAGKPRPAGHPALTRQTVFAVVFITYVLLLFATGINPAYTVRHLAVPAAETLAQFSHGFDPGHLEEAIPSTFWSLETIKPAVTGYAIAAAILAVAKRLKKVPTPAASGSVPEAGTLLLLYDEKLRVEFSRRLRGEKKFRSVEELTEQVARDIGCVIESLR